MAKFKSSFIIFLTLLPLFYGCKDDVPQNSSKEFLSFVVEAKYNSKILKKDIVGKIEGNTITLSFPDNIAIDRITATFTFKGKEVQISGTKQISGFTSNNFNNPIIYTIIAEDLSEINYKLIIKLYDEGLSFSSFSFNKNINPFLKKDYLCTVDNEKIISKISTSSKNLIASFETKAKGIFIDGVSQVSGVTLNDFSKPITYTLVSENGFKKSYSVNITWASAIPQIIIVTENMAPIDSKDNYINATITIEGNDWGEDYTGTTRIRGRGNSTWGMPKKPYRLKLDESTSILGLLPEKDWVLLANYIDPTLMLNSVAFKIGQLLQLQYTNNAIPVDLTINNKYIGSYVLTEQVELSSSRVNIDKKDGVLLELDLNYDEDFKFYSNHYRLPVMVKDPDITSDSQFQKIKNDFHQLEDSVKSIYFPNNEYDKLIDIESLAKYFVVYNLTHNMEINHPKSTYIYKDKNGKYFMGPIWDFDWAFDYEGTSVHFGSSQNPLFKKLPSNSTGYYFFTRFLDDPTFVALYKQTWNNFKKEKMSLLLNYIDDYAASITESQKNDYEVWKKGTTNFQYKIESLKAWLERRALYLDEYMNNL
ncbi:MAG: CotH kinase family protein [Petrimonas sp.]|jgi:hypothetical protein